MEYLQKMKEKFPSHVTVVEMIQCKGTEITCDYVYFKGKQHLEQFFNEILNKKGEGVMLRAAKSLYTSGRSDSLRKYKKFFDTEVNVLENKYPHGLQCQQ
jgi:ATP-dependent DNA ligase